MGNWTTRRTNHIILILFVFYFFKKKKKKAWWAISKKSHFSSLMTFHYYRSYYIFESYPYGSLVGRARMAKPKINRMKVKIIYFEASKYIWKKQNIFNFWTWITHYRNILTLQNYIYILKVQVEDYLKTTK